MAEFPSLGSRCALAACGALSFLPVECARCSRAFCEAHAAADRHKCGAAAATANEAHVAQGAVETDGRRCSLPHCDYRKYTTVACDQCAAEFCLPHRHPADHQCAALLAEQRSSALAADEKAARVAGQLDSVAQALAHSGGSAGAVAGSGIAARPLTAPPPPVGGKQRARHDRVLLMKLKAAARGEHGLIPDCDKFYLRLRHGRMDEKQADVAFVVSKRWSVGRCVDSAARLISLANDNAQTHAKKLRMYTVEEGGRTADSPTPFDHIVADAVGDDNGARVVLIYDA